MNLSPTLVGHRTNNVKKIHSATGIILLAFLLIHWTYSLYFVPVDQNQGEVYRIIYIHVPSAFAAFLGAGVLLFASIRALGKQSEKALPLARAATEVGLLFTLLALATGSIWGKPTWGTWWTWDPRLTTTFLLSILFVGWLLLYNSLPPGDSRTRGCAYLGIMISADVPIIYQSVNWWRTLHQPQTILRPGGSSTIDPEMLTTLLSGIGLIVLITFWLIWQRKINIELQNDLDQKSLSGV